MGARDHADMVSEDRICVLNLCRCIQSNGTCVLLFACVWEGLFTSWCPHGDHWSDPVISLLRLSVLGRQCPVASRRAAPSVIPAHEPDSHHKAPIVFAGRTGSRSACHSAATCVTRRHSGACFCFCFLLSFLHTELLFLENLVHVLLSTVIVSWCHQ